MKCKHKWSIVSWGRTISEKCRRCGEVRERPATSVEKAAFRRSTRPRPDDLHWHWNKFRKKIDDKFGYSAMTSAEKYATKFDDRFYVVTVDDAKHASSSLILYIHKDERQFNVFSGKETPHFMGVSVKFIPQISSDSSTFFLYPENIERLIDVLRHIRKRMIKYPNVKKYIRSRT